MKKNHKMEKNKEPSLKGGGEHSTERMPWKQLSKFLWGGQIRIAVTLHSLQSWNLQCNVSDFHAHQNHYAIWDPPKKIEGPQSQGHGSVEQPLLCMENISLQFWASPVWKESEQLCQISGGGLSPRSLSRPYWFWGAKDLSQHKAPSCAQCVYVSKKGQQPAKTSPSVMWCTMGLWLSFAAVLPRESVLFFVCLFLPNMKQIHRWDLRASPVMLVLSPNGRRLSLMQKTRVRGSTIANYTCGTTPFFSPHDFQFNCIIFFHVQITRFIWLVHFYSTCPPRSWR